MSALIIATAITAVPVVGLALERLLYPPAAECVGGESHGD